MQILRRLQCWLTRHFYEHYQTQREWIVFRCNHCGKIGRVHSRFLWKLRFILKRPLP